VGAFPISDYLRFRYVYHVPLAILATGLDMLAALALVCGFILDTIVELDRGAILSANAGLQGCAAVREKRKERLSNPAKRGS